MKLLTTTAILAALATPALAQTAPADRAPVQPQQQPTIEQEVSNFQVTVGDSLSQIKLQFVQRDNQIAADQQKIAGLLQDGQKKDKEIADLKDQIAKLTPKADDKVAVPNAKLP